ncbi:cmbl, partial [Symbiodinium pilosum]
PATQILANMSLPACACCPPGAEPLREMKDYKPKHSMGTIKDLPCYVATPPVPTQKGVVLFADMFGVHTGRHKQFCDMLAEKGYLAICPDFLAGKPYSMCAPTYGTNYCCMLEFICLLTTGTFDRKTRRFAWDTYMKQKVLDEILPWMRSKGVSSFAAVGFCWGTYGAMKCAAYPEFKCCACFHPSNEGFCKATKEDDLE